MTYAAKISNYFSQRNRSWILSLIVLIALIYLPFIGNDFFFDDDNFFNGNAKKAFENATLHFNTRWFAYISLKWTAAVFGDSVTLFFHVGNMLLHAANVVLLFLMLRQLKALALPLCHTQTYFNWGIWLGTLFFACNPVAVYAVGYVIQRSILMATFFTLAMQLAYLRGLINGQKYWLALSVLFYFLAVFSKEHSLMAPAVIVMMTILLKPYNKTNWRILATTWLGFIVVALFVILKMKGISSIAYEHDATSLLEQQAIVASAQNVHLLSAMTQAGLFFKYLFLWVIPNPAWMSIDMRETFASSISAWQNWLKVACFIAYGGIALKLLLRRGKAGLIGFALLYPWLLFMVEFSSVRIQEPFVLYRSYLWMPGLLLLIPLALDGLQNKKAMIITFVLIVGLIPLSWNRLWVFADTYRLWNDAAVLLKNDTVPGAARIFYNRGKLELDAKRWEEAIADFKRVKAINPKIEQSYNYMGTAYAGLGKYQEAINQFDQAIALKPDYAEAYFGKGMVLKRIHSYQEGSTYIEKSCSLGNTLACFIASFSSMPPKP